MKILNVKKFLIPFDSGVVVIKHWKIHNLIRKDRYKETVYKQEKSVLMLKENQAYTIGLPSGQPNDNQRLTQVRLGKDSIGKVSIGKDSIEEEVVEGEIVSNSSTTTSTDEAQKIYGKYNNVCMTVGQYNRLLGICASQKLLDELVDNLSEKIETGDEKPYRGDYPNAHYIRLVKYFDYRRKNPDKFRQAAESKSRAAEVMDKLYEEMKGQDNGT